MDENDLRKFEKEEKALREQYSFNHPIWEQYFTERDKKSFLHIKDENGELPLEKACRLLFGNKNAKQLNYKKTMIEVKEYGLLVNTVSLKSAINILKANGADIRVCLKMLLKGENVNLNYIDLIKKQ